MWCHKTTVISCSVWHIISRTMSYPKIILTAYVVLPILYHAYSPDIMTLWKPHTPGPNTAVNNFTYPTSCYEII